MRRRPAIEGLEGRMLLAVPDIAISLEAASDTGSSSTDGITQRNNGQYPAPVFDVTGLVQGVEIDLLRDDQVVNSVTSFKGGTVPIPDLNLAPGNPQPGAPIPDGTYSYTAVERGITGEVLATSPPIDVTILTATPPAPTVALAPQSDTANQDTGESDSDGITQASPSQPPTLIVSNVVAGSSVSLFRAPSGQSPSLVDTATTPAGAAALNLLDRAATPDGTYVYTAQQVDVAGNSSAVGPPITVIYHTTPPAAPSAPTLLSPATIDAQGILETAAASPQFQVSGIVPSLAPQGNGNVTVDLYADGAKVAFLVAPPGGGSVNITDPGPVPIGRHTFQVGQIDDANNVSQLSAPLDVMVIPAPPGSPVLDPSSDSGVPGDNITSVSLNLVFDVQGASPQSTVQLFRDGELVGTAPPNPTGGGPTQVTDPGPVTTGPHVYTSVQIIAGVSSLPSAPLTVTIVPVKTPAKPTLRLDPASDTGLQGDSKTVSRRPILSGTADPGSTVTVTIVHTGQVYASGVASSDGMFSVSPSFLLTDGVYQLQARETNPVTAKAASPPSVPLTLTITSVTGDYNGDGKTDLSLFRRDSPAVAEFFVKDQSPPGGPAFGSGSLDIPFQGDFDGDGKTDLALYRPSTGTWFIQESSAGFVSFSLGVPQQDIPVVGDFDVPGRAEAAVYRPSTGQWFIMGHSKPLALGGDPTDMPVPGDYDGTGTDQIAVYRASTGQWFISGHSKPETLGGPKDIPIRGDYDGTGKDEIAVFRTSTQQWLIGGHTVLAFGDAGDIPAPGDYDGTGKTEVAVYRPSAGIWLIGGHPTSIAFGGPIDIPLGAPYFYREIPIPGMLATRALDAVRAESSVSASPGDLSPPVQRRQPVLVQHIGASALQPIARRPVISAVDRRWGRPSF
jgi:hypothetical protein